MRVLPTVRIADGSGGSIVINAADFDPDRHERFVETSPDGEPVEAQEADGLDRSSKGSTDTKGTKGRRRPRRESR